MDWQEVTDELGDPAVYHYHPPLEQVNAWLDHAGLAKYYEFGGELRRT